jgi:tetratricopeptide (TPR) repeat protein
MTIRRNPIVVRAALALLLALISFARPLGAQEVDWAAFTEVYERASASYSAGNLERAEREYLEAAEMNPTAPETFFMLGIISMQQERRHEAARRFRQSLETNRRYPPARNQRPSRLRNDRDSFAGLTTLAGGMLQDADASTADSLLAYALTLVPHSRDALHYRALALNATQQWAELTAVTERLLEVDPLNEAAMTMLYNSYAGQAASGMDEMALRAREMSDRIRTMPLKMVELTSEEENEGQVIVSGRVVGGTMQPGRRVHITVTLSDAAGRRAGIGTATVVAPAEGQSVAFRLSIRVNQPPYALSYTVR